MKKKGYFSNLFNIIVFSIMMLILLTIVTFFIILIADAANQASSGASEYTPNRDFLSVFAVVVIVSVPYTIFYIVTLILYFVRRKDAGSNVQIQVNSGSKVDDKDIKTLNKKYNAEVMENEIETKGNLKYTYVREGEPDYSKKTIRSFSLYLTFDSIVLLIILHLIFYALGALLYFSNLILFIVIISVATISLGFSVYLYFYLAPKRLYTSIMGNKNPSSLRVYEDRVEQINVLPTGERIIYTFDYGYTKCKDQGEFLYLKTKNEKLKVGLLVDKKKVGEEITNYILSKLRKNK